MNIGEILTLFLKSTAYYENIYQSSLDYIGSSLNFILIA